VTASKASTPANATNVAVISTYINTDKVMSKLLLQTDPSVRPTREHETSMSPGGMHVRVHAAAPSFTVRRKAR
jgi:hypothetical protein